MRFSLALAVGLAAAFPLSLNAQLASRVPKMETTASNWVAPELAEALDLGQASEQLIELPERLVDDVMRVSVQMAGQVETLELWPNSVRDEDFDLRMQVADGSYVSVEPGPVTTVRGRVLGKPDSVVAGQILDGSLSAIVVLDRDLPMWGIQPMRDVDANAPASSHVVYDSRDRLPSDVSCGTTDVLEPGSVGKGGDGGGSSFAGQSTQVCDIAFDADTQYYNLNGSSVTNTQQDIENIMNAVEALYIDAAGISYNITTIIVRTSEPDPYSTTSASGMLGEFQNHWNSQQQSVVRDVAHLMTGKNISGSTIGIAYLNVICSLNSAYGLSQSRFSNNFTSRVALTAHELGHNWSAPHCNGSAGCQIMCSGLGGCGGTGAFGPSASNQINNKKNSVGCLVSSIPPDPPTITSVSPTSVPTASPTVVTLTGTDFEQLVSFEVGGTTFDAGDLFSTTETSAQFVAPATTSLGSTTVSITNVSGTSNSASFDYVANDPPIVGAAPFALAGQDFEWKLGGDAGDTGYLLVSLDGATFPFSGDNILLNFIIVAVVPLDAAGLATIPLTPLPASASGVNMSSQLVVFNGSGYDDASTIKTTVIF